MSNFRRQPTRTARTNAPRASSYYARGAGYGGIAPDAMEDAPQPAARIGFYPAITDFTDGLAALPKEMIRHYTLFKETEGKAIPPAQQIADLISRIRALPPPPKQVSQLHSQAFMGLSLNASLNGSLNGSVVDGSIPRAPESLPTTQEQLSTQPYLDPYAQTRQSLYAQLRERLRFMNGLLDEKNTLIAANNDTLAKQLARLNGVLPHVENELSEEARFGSNTHWALPHMKELRRASGVAGNDRNNRGVQAAKDLAAAAAFVHEGDIAATRSEARREAVQARRRNHNVDSDFDDRPVYKRGNAGKVRRAHDALAADLRAGGQAPKRRRVDKGAVIERSLGAALNGRMNARDLPASARATPAVEVPRKRSKQALAQVQPRRRNYQNSPSLAASPTRTTFPTSIPRENGTTAPRSAPSKPHQGSVQSNRAAELDSRSQPESAPPSRRMTATQIDANEEAAAAQETPADIAQASEPPANQEPNPAAQDGLQDVVDGPPTTSVAESLKTEDPEPPLDEQQTILRSRNGSRASKPGTPIAPPTQDTEPAAPMMSRSRSGRGPNAASHHAPSSPASSPKRSHAQPVAADEQSPAPAEDVKDQVVADAVDEDQPEDEDMAEEMDGVAPSSPGSDEPRYCICGRGSYGNMIACDNENCPTEWFHLPCVGLSKAPSSRTKWYCEDCREQMRREAKDKTFANR